jgi:DNA-binding response OmpR family regulator
MQKILLVEDDQFLRKIYIDMLSSEFSVTTAEDGLTAYDTIIEKPFDLILLDMYLPKLDGKTIFEQLEKNFPNQYKNKIVFLTNDESTGTVDFFKKNNLNYLIKSSLNPEQFVNKIKTFFK